MNKKFSIIIAITALLFSINILFSFSSTKSAMADTTLNIKSKSCYLMDVNSKTVIYSTNENLKLPIASMCKIMTLNIIFDTIESGKLDINSKINVSENASGMGGSQIFLDANEDYEVKELIKGIVVASANDACVALAEVIAGSEDEFVSLMNKKAKELNMENTSFVNCTGLPKAGQYSTAKDVAIMFNELISHKEYFDFSQIWMDKIHHKNDRITEISNTNKLIRFYDCCDGGKTGYTSEAGHCLASTAYKNDMRVISVIICAENSKSRFNDSVKMFNYAFNNFENKKVIVKGENLSEMLPVKNGKINECKISANDDFYIFCKKGDKQTLQIELKLNEITAPIKIGDEVGIIEVYKNSVNIGTIRIVASENIDEKTFFDQINSIIDNWCVVI